MPEIENLIIFGDIEVGGTLTVSYDYTGDNPEGATEYQWYRNGEAIIWETSSTYTLLLTDQSYELICAVCPIDDQGNVGEVVYSEAITIDYYSLEVKPIEKEYIIKLYDWSMAFKKVLSSNLITNNIKFSENINWGQGELVLNINLPIDTDYFDNVRYCKVFVSTNSGIDNKLIYSGRLSKMSRTFSNNSENITATFLSLFSLLNDIYFEQDWELTFQIEDTPDNIIKAIIDYFDTIYPNILSYDNNSIDSYGSTVYLEFNEVKCWEALKSVLNGLSYYLFVWADGKVYFKPRPQTATHLLTYEKDITALTIPEDYEQVANAVRAAYSYVWGSHTWITDVALDNDSITKHGRKEIIISNEALYWETAAELYRDSYLANNKDWKQNISLTVNSLYPIENIHPGDTIKIRNLGLDIDNLQISQVSYTYEQIVLNLEYYTNISDQIFNS